MSCICHVYTCQVYVMLGNMTYIIYVIYICTYIYIYIYIYTTHILYTYIIYILLPLNLKMNLKQKGHKSIHWKAKLKLKGVQFHEKILGNMTNIFYS